MIGFVGLGAMGKPMAAHVLRARGELLVSSRSVGPIDELVALGAEHAADPAEMAARSDVVILSLPGPAEVRSVVLNPAFLDAARPGFLLIDTSTIDHGLSMEIAESLGRRGARAVDAPVSGGELGAKEGVLSAMVGGEKEAFEAARPVLDEFATTVVHVGPSGSGQVTKAANQVIVAGTLAIVGEALSLLRSADVDLGSALDAIGGGLAGSEVLRRKASALLADDFEPGFRIDLHVKDLGIAIDMARMARAPIPLSAMAMQLMVSNQAHGEGALDHAAVAKTIQRLGSLAR